MHMKNRRVNLSELFNSIKEKQFNFVIPNPSKCFWVKLNRNDNALLFNMNRGYIETSDIESCYYLSLFLVSNKDKFFKLLGSIDKVKLEDGNIVYRQRICFKSFYTLLLVIKSLKGKLVIGNDFNINTNCLTYCGGELPAMEKYANKFKLDVNTWLTLSLKIHIYYLCKKLSILDKLVLDNGIMKLQRGTKGFLDRSPFLCGTSLDGSTSSILKVEDYDNSMLYSGNKKLSFGYTSSNIRRDIKIGLFKCEG